MIPIFINVHNRVTCLQKQIRRFEDAGIKDIILIDNASTYPPLLKYLETVPYKVYRLGENYGSYALWDAGVLEKSGHTDKYFIYTDPDIIPIVDCPNDFIHHFCSVLEQFPAMPKVGFGLRIDNLPANELTKQIIEWETKYWEKQVGDNLYEGNIDTTFSLYRPNAPKANGHAWGLRTGYPYIAEHTTWYEDFNNLPDEMIYYVKYLEPKWSHWYRDKKGNI
jgi:hypothetical protein